MSIATENFIKIIYQSEKGGDEDGIKPGNIAARLSISNAAATDMARKLARQELVDYQKYQKLKLTPKGQKMALEIVRKHRLWETFLYKVFNFSLQEIHREAELLEHLTSDFLTERINEFLGYPSFDPHGDPIPDAQGKLPPLGDQLTLADAETGSMYKVSRLIISENDFFDFCHNNNIRVGAKIKVEKQYTSKMTEIKIRNTKLLLNVDISNMIYVEKINE